MTSLADMLAVGTGVPTDVEEAVQWYQKAADKGSLVAEVRLGLRYASGAGVTNDPARAIQLLTRAAGQLLHAGAFSLVHPEAIEPLRGKSICISQSLGSAVTTENQQGCPLAFLEARLEFE